MATTFTLARPDVFNAGTVSVYAKTAAGVPASGAPKGSVVTTATATGAGVSFTGLADNTQYIAYQGSPDRYISFRTTPVASGGGAETDPVAEADLATHAALTTTAHGGFVAVESDPVAGAALTTHAALTTTAHGGLLPATTASQDIVGDFFDTRRTSEVRTMPREISTSPSSVLTSGTIYVGLAIARTAGSFTKARWANGLTAAATISVARLGVWNDSNVRLADVALSTTAGATTLFDNIALGSTVTVTAGQHVWLGIVFVGTTIPSIRGTQMAAAIGQLAPVNSRVQSGYVSGALPDPLVPAGGGSQFIPWIELIP